MAAIVFLNGKFNKNETVDLQNSQANLQVNLNEQKRDFIYIAATPVENEIKRVFKEWASEYKINKISFTADRTSTEIYYLILLVEKIVPMLLLFMLIFL